MLFRKSTFRSLNKAILVLTCKHFFFDKHFLNKGVNHSGFESQKAHQPKNMPLHKTYCLLNNGPQYAHFGVINLDGKPLR